MDGSSDFDQIVVISNFNFVSEKNSLIWGTNLESGRAGLKLWQRKERHP